MNPIEPFEQLPDHARIRIYAAERLLDEGEERKVIDLLNSFCGEWRSHGRPVTSGAAMIESRFAIIAGVIPDGDISGCGIDASVHALDRAAEELDFRWLPALAVHFRGEDGTIFSVSRPEFRELSRAGQIDAATPVFDLSIPSVKELRDGKLERPAGSTWHERVFHLSVPLV